jgi:hypothetical protein
MRFISESACLQVRTSSTWTLTCGTPCWSAGAGMCSVTSAFAEDMSFIKVLS